MVYTIEIVLSSTFAVCCSEADPHCLEGEEDHCYGCHRSQVGSGLSYHHGDDNVILLVMGSGNTCYSLCFVI